VAVEAGLLTGDRLRSSAWQRLFRDAAASLLLPGAVITGVSAGVMWGVELATTTDDVELTVPPGRHPLRIAGVRTRRSALAPEDVRRRDGVPVTAPEATACGVAAALPVDEAVVAVDRMIAGGKADLDPLRSRAARSHGMGSAKARTVIGLAD
jgi:hypothetical protein